MATKKSAKVQENGDKTEKSVSLRDHAAKKRDKAAQPRRISQATSTASKPFRVFGKALKTVFRPFRFLLAPFKTRPARLIGRVLSKVLFLDYFKGSWQELRQVEWPNAKMTAKLSFAVLMFSVVFGIFIALVDFVLDKLFRSVLL